MKHFISKIKNGDKQITKFYLPVLLSISSILIILYLILNEHNQDFNFVKIGDKYESCLGCHQQMRGFSLLHDPRAISCASCHRGNPFSSDSVKAHDGLILVPGNIAVAKQSCGQENCHPAIVKNIQSTLMNTGRGMVTVNRYVFSETDTPDGEGRLADIKHSPSEIHLRNLCASCHLSQTKAVPDTLHQLSRGGGCLACHLFYSDEAKVQFVHYQEQKILPTIHPSLTIKVTSDHCFGCHSRSGRISTNYEGWHETLLDSIPDHSEDEYRILEDGRIFIRQPEDVHHEKGLECIDCHTWRETMGNGFSHNHQEEQIEISCVDCHFSEKPAILSQPDLADTDKKILKSRSWDDDNLKFVGAKKTGKALLNVQVTSDNQIILKSKNSDNIHFLKSPLSICTNRIEGHSRLSCKSCHSAWAPHCLGCHTQYFPDVNSFDHIDQKEVAGGWVEFSSDFYADPPTLGIRTINNEEIIDTFIPGMILTITHENGDELFHRLYAPTSPHTTSSKARSCQSCHTNSLALGVGRGELLFEKTDNKKGFWKFVPLYAINPHDNLPEDAWTGFLMTRQLAVSTRIGARPFNREEQRKILRVGACLTCHDPDENNLRKLYFNFRNALSDMRDECYSINLSKAFNDRD